MVAALKISVIGGSSYYTPGLIEALNDSGLVLDLVLNGRDREKLEQVGKVCQRLACERIKITWTTDRKASLADVDYVLLQVRIGGMTGRAHDERFPLKYGIIGEETIVPGGASLAARTIPYLKELAKELKEVAPRAKVLALTNPNNMVIDYFNRYTDIEAIGFCDLPTSLIRGVVEAHSGEKKTITEIWPEISFNYYGINHLAFLNNIFYQGQAVDLEAIAPKLGLDPRLVQTLGLLPVSYLRYYYFTSSIWQKAQTGPTRGEVLEAKEADLKKEYQAADGKKPAGLKERPVPWYGDVIIPYLKATKTQGKAIIVTENKGALSDLRPDSVAELPVIITKGKVERLYQGSLPAIIRGLVVSVSESERLIVDGLANESKKQFMQGLLAHPLIRELDKAIAVLQEIKEINNIAWL